METFWYCALTLMLAVYVVLDGFDFGLGIIYRFVARTEADRRTALASIGPSTAGPEAREFSPSAAPIRMGEEDCCVFIL